MYQVNQRSQDPAGTQDSGGHHHHHHHHHHYQRHDAGAGDVDAEGDRDYEVG